MIEVQTIHTKKITIAHSPDSDDAFMFYALAKGKLDTCGLEITQVTQDIETLNRTAPFGKYEVTAISFAAYPPIADQYDLMSCGASMGIKYGPIVVARRKHVPQSLKNLRIAIPGKLTTAYLCLQLFEQDFHPVEMPFDGILSAVANGEVDAGLIIHEGQLTYANFGLDKILDLGQWWTILTGLPLPLGGNAIRKDLGAELIAQTTALIKDSIIYALANRADALSYARTFGPQMTTDLADRYVSMYVNDLTVDCGNQGRRAIALLYEKAFASGILERQIIPKFAN